MRIKRKKSLNVSRQLRDLNQKVQHRLYKIKKKMSNLDKQYKIRNIISISIIAIYIIQNLYHLFLNGFNTNYVIGVFTLGLLYMPVAYLVKTGIND